MTGTQIGQAVKNAGREFLAEVELAEHKTINFAADVAFRRSEGTAVERLLATPVADGGYGHPYGFGPVGMAGPRGSIPNGGDPGIINIQTGEFLQGWETEFGNFKAGKMINSLVNDTDHAKEIEDTPNGLQIRRPFLEGVAKEVLPVRLTNLQEAFRRCNK